jgi:hypothetical protein
MKTNWLNRLDYASILHHFMCADSIHYYPITLHQGSGCFDYLKALLQVTLIIDLRKQFGLLLIEGVEG